MPVLGDIAIRQKGFFMVFYMLSSEDYENSSKNYGDCTIIIGDDEAIIYDCGAAEHAYNAIRLLDKHKIDKAFVILSHNDSDHFRGIDTLIDEDRVKAVYTVLLLKYKDEILDRVSDNRVTRQSVGDRIVDMYDNVASLGGRVILRDIYMYNDKLPLGVSLVGPNKKYMLDVVAKGLDPLQGNTADNETIINATSLQIDFRIGTNRILLTGDCSPDAIPDNVDFSDYTFIQLPHHGKPDSAKRMFERADRNNKIIWIVSDNTGDSNGGSDNRIFRGHNVKNTRSDGIIKINEGHSYIRIPTGSLHK